MIADTFPKILKSQGVVGKTLVLKDATIEDASFILTLRTDSKRSRFLSHTDPELTAQREWLADYAAA